ncbi:DUF4169 family protein [uncultured Devosia sp.]|uniref:DUF4169 family protein n=1 Tax=uncultured Devosia sp. TaxID=211434 RepID=UPI0035CB5D31
MAEIVNLRTARKRKAKAEQSAQADRNRIAFGRTKAERNLTKARSEQVDKRLDDHKRDD